MTSNPNKYVEERKSFIGEVFERYQLGQKAKLALTSFFDDEREAALKEGAASEREEILAALPTRFTNTAEIMKRYKHGEVTQEWMNGYNANLEEIRTLITSRSKV